MSRLRSDRVAGAACLVVAAWSALQTSTYRVAFLTDPIGPRALPWLACGLLGLGGLGLLLWPGPEPHWPSAGVSRRFVVMVAGFVAYTMVLEFMGFMLSTTLLVTLLARVFGGGSLRGILAGGVFSAMMWLLFVLVLGVPLPIGSLFLRD